MKKIRLSLSEAEKTLTDEQKRSFALILQGRQTGSMDYLMQDFRAIHATALQRCEAFLRVKGLWKD